MILWLQSAQHRYTHQLCNVLNDIKWTGLKPQSSELVWTSAVIVADFAVGVTPVRPTSEHFAKDHVNESFDTKNICDSKSDNTDHCLNCTVVGRTGRGSAIQPASVKDCVSSFVPASCFPGVVFLCLNKGLCEIVWAPCVCSC